MMRGRETIRVTILSLATVAQTEKGEPFGGSTPAARTQAGLHTPLHAAMLRIILIFWLVRKAA
jgi:hypothetical protein